MSEDLVLHDGCIVPDIDLVDGDGRHLRAALRSSLSTQKGVADLCYHHPPQCVGNRSIYSDEIKFNSRRRPALYGDDQILKLVSLILR